MIPLIENKTHATKRLDTLLELLKEDDSKRKRETIQFKDWELVDEGLRISKKVYPMRDSAMKTLLKLFKMPINFYYGESPTDMLVRDVNRMKKEYTEDSEMSIFYSGNEVRAVTRPDVGVIKGYVPVLDSLNLGKKIFHRATFNDYGLRVMTTDKEKEIKVEKGDIINSGVEVMYSDVGTFPTTGVPFLNRLVCTNGLVMHEKSKFVTGFNMRHTIKTPEEIFLKTLHSNLAKINADTKVLTDTFKMMKDKPVKFLPQGEAQVKKLRSAITPEKFDIHEGLTMKIMEQDSDKERIVINPEAILYSVLDVTTREAKQFAHLERRKIEGLAGSLVQMTMNRLN